MQNAGFSARDIIAAKQRGRGLTHDEIDWFVRATTDGKIPDYQVSAFLMAVFFRGMNLRETRDLTTAMIDSGKVLSLPTVPGSKVDKHSTGGVGDKVSLIVGPLVASLGVFVPMVSGRALGHTGGTLDKLESIPGFRTNLTRREFERTVRRIGISIIGQTDEIAPADRRFYAIRDVTSTIVCPPLIVSSILSKKIASGADAIVFDIKCGQGAFMKTVAEGRRLADLLSKVARMLGKKTTAVLTRMDEPLGYTIGNAMEVREVVEVLKGRWIDDLIEVSFALGAEMLMLAGKTKNREQAYTLLRSALVGGKALQKFRELVSAQGGDPRVVDEPRRLAQPRHAFTLKAHRRGYISGIDALAAGEAATMLGAGRRKKDDRIDYFVGIEFLRKRGAKLEKGDVIARIYATQRAEARRCGELLRGAVEISPERPKPIPIVIGKSRGAKRAMRSPSR